MAGMVRLSRTITSWWSARSVTATSGRTRRTPTAKPSGGVTRAAGGGPIRDGDGRASMEQPRSGRKLMARELEDVSVVNRHRLAIAAALAGVAGSGAAPAAGAVLRVRASGEGTPNRGANIRA